MVIFKLSNLDANLNESLVAKKIRVIPLIETIASLKILVNLHTFFNNKGWKMTHKQNNLNSFISLFYYPLMLEPMALWMNPL